MTPKSSAKPRASAPKPSASPKVGAKKAVAAKPEAKKVQVATSKKSAAKKPASPKRAVPGTSSIRIKVETPSLESMKVGTGKIQSLRKFKKSLGWWSGGSESV
jgi:hypothetical protein